MEDHPKQVGGGAPTSRTLLSALQTSPISEGFCTAVRSGSPVYKEKYIGRPLHILELDDHHLIPAVYKPGAAANIPAHFQARLH